MIRHGLTLLATAILLTTVGRAEARPLRILSLDQCGDQYALALAPDATLALSPRADDPDSWLRRSAKSHRRMRPTLESAVAFRPDVVVRYWGGEPKLLSALEARGVRVVTIGDAQTMRGIQDNIIAVADAVEHSGRGQALVDQMNAKLREPRVAVSLRSASALYLTAGGFTAGPGTLIDAILTTAGLVNLTLAPGFAPMSVERIALSPPSRFVLGFFDQVRADWRGPGRHPVVRKAATGKVVARLPAAVLSCPAWFAADAVALLKAAS